MSGPFSASATRGASPHWRMATSVRRAPRKRGTRHRVSVGRGPSNKKSKESHMKRCIAILVATLVPVSVCAQESALTWPGLNPSGLSTVYVLDDAGVETSGRLLQLNPDSLVILVGGAERRFEAARVRRIQKRGDSLRNGALIGAIVGAALGLAAAGISDCSGGGSSCPGSRVTLVLVSTGVYAAIGTGIDALVVGRTTLYDASKVPPSAGREGSAPLAYRGHASVNLSVRW